MTQRKIRCTAVAAGLAAVLTLATPVHAASPIRRAASPGWLDAVWHWVAGAWTGSGASQGGQIPGLKKGLGIDPDGSIVTTQPASTSGDKGLGIDPDG